MRRAATMQTNATTRRSTLPRGTPALFAWATALIVAGVTSLFCVGVAAQTTPDYKREQRWADEIVPALVVGDAVRIETATKRQFLGLFAEGRSGRGAVMLLHGSGVHPDFSIVGQLRTLLNDAGYTTLSIQMPVLAADAPAEQYVALFSEAGERIAAGLAWLRERKHARIALVSHSMGARMAREYLKRNVSAPLNAWVPLAISDGELTGLPRMAFPVFDVYAEKDFEVILAKKNDRAAVLRTMPGAKQAMIYGTDHFFVGKEKDLDRLLRELIDPVMR